MARVSEHGKALGAAIRARRKATGVTQQELAAVIGVAPVVMGRMELGTREVRASELISLSRALGTSADELLGVQPLTPDDLLRSLTHTASALFQAAREAEKELTRLRAAVTSSDPDEREELNFSYGRVRGTLEHTAIIVDRVARTPLFRQD